MSYTDTLRDLLSESFDQMTQGILWNQPVWDSSGEKIVDFEYFYANREGLRYLNLGPGVIPGLRLSTAATVTEELRKEFMREMVNLCQSGGKVYRTIYNPAIDKHSRITRIAFKGGVLTIVDDITEELKRIQELQEQKALSELMVNASLNPVCVLEAVRNVSGKIIDLNYLQVNGRYEKLVGKTAGELLGRSLGKLFPSAKTSGTFEQHSKVIETGEPARYEVYRHDEAFEGWFDISAVRIGYSKVFITFNDITEQKRSQQLLEHSERQLKDILETQLSYVYVYTPVFDEQGVLVNFRYKMINRSGRKILPDGCKDAEGKLVSEVFPSYKSTPSFSNHVKAYYAAEPSYYQTQYDADGLHLWLDSLATRIGADLLVCHQDLTKSKELQTRLERSIEELKRSNANLEEFAHAASHDLKEPVRKIHFYVERLKTKLSDRMLSEEVRLFDRVETATERMRYLIDDLLEYSHVSHHNHPKQEKIDLNEKLQAVLGDLEVPIREKEATINVGELPVVKGYRRQLQQLFQNLVGNALKYNKPGQNPVIEVRAALVSGNEDLHDLPASLSGKRYHLITIQDNGIGFEQEDAERIFNMFTRLHGNAEYKGTGVGLSIVRKVVENHCGFIKAESSPGEGATFKVYLPADEV